MRNVISFILLSFSIVSYSQTKSKNFTPYLTETPAINESMSEIRLARIDSMLSNSIKQNEIPGAVALIARNGKIVYFKAFGMADNESGRHLKRDDIFRIASQTKAVTTTAVMMLWEEGKFGLDDPISRYIPEFKNMVILDSLIQKDTSYFTRPAKKQITIRNLLTHTSGIGYGMIDDDNFRKIYKKAGIIDGFTTKNVTIRENVLKLAKLPLHHEPGSKFTYSEGLDVLGYFIEKMSGIPLDKFFKERIFEPLNMKDTYFYLPDSKKGRLVTAQTIKDGKWIKFAGNEAFDCDYPVKGAKTFFAGGAGLSSTAEDYANFLQMYLNYGELNGIRLLSRTTVQFMMENQVGNLFDANAGFGLGFGITNQKGEASGGKGSAGTFGWGGYFNTLYFADPKYQVIGILMKQTHDIPSDETSSKFEILVEQAIDN